MRIILGTLLVVPQFFAVIITGKWWCGPVLHQKMVRLKLNWSGYDKEPTMQLFNRLNSWENFWVTLRSICFEACVIYSSVIIGTFVSGDKLFLEDSSRKSLLTAANFLFSSMLPFEKTNLLSTFIDVSQLQPGSIEQLNEHCQLHLPKSMTVYFHYNRHYCC